MIHLILAQHDPWEGHFPAEQTPGMSASQIVFMIVSSIVVQVLFGLWARSKADDHGVNPWAAFAAGFFLAYIGVRLVPLLKSNALFFQPKPKPAYLPPHAPPQPGPNVHGQPVAPPEPPPVQVDADGYLQCPACGARAKAGRKACMACGAPLPQS